jgi:hypothetical protein
MSYMKKLIPFIAVVALIMGCATLNPNADVFVVRVEQAQTAANATFDFVLHMDNANRSMWMTNAPAFHNYCNWLRTPQAYGAQSVSRAVAMQLNVDDLKAAYKASRTTGSSNALWSAWSVLNQAILQSTSWSNIITTPVSQ